jgi:hypothetical protein
MMLYSAACALRELRSHKARLEKFDADASLCQTCDRVAYQEFGGKGWKKSIPVESNGSNSF